MNEQTPPQDRPHPPSTKKLQRQREKGEVARSNDLSQSIGIAGLTLTITFTGAMLGLKFAGMMEHLLANADQFAEDLTLEGARTSLIIRQSTERTLWPWLIIPTFAVVGGYVAQRAIVFSTTKLKPKLSRISPISNARQKFGKTGLFEFAKSFAKLLLFSTILSIVLVQSAPDLFLLMQNDPSAIVIALGQNLHNLLFWFSLLSASVGAADFFWQRNDLLQRNRMTHQEMKDELKESEGDAQFKQERQKKARSMTSFQITQTVPKADVVIVNPTHYAVALQWSRAKGSVPICVAKAVDHQALTIRQIAMRSGVPLHSDPPTARSLYANLDLGAEVKQEHFKAVAAAIRFADQMRRKTVIDR